MTRETHESKEERGKEERDYNMILEYMYNSSFTNLPRNTIQNYLPSPSQVTNAEQTKRNEANEANEANGANGTRNKPNTQCLPLVSSRIDDAGRIC
jgi:hypothetical protein